MKRFLSRVESERLLTEPCGDDLKFAIFCALHAGLRIGEVLAAKRSWFDFTAGLLHICAYTGWHPKNDKDRSIPLTADFKAFLSAYKPFLDGAPDDYMFRPHKTSLAGIRRADFTIVYRHHLVKCGIGKFTFHGLRRTFASLHASAGTPLFIVAALLGDTLPATMAHYAHLSFEGVDIERAWR